MTERRAKGWVRGLVLIGGALAGCGGGPEPLAPSHKERWREREQAAAKPAGKTPQGTLVPVDAWRQRLEEELPAPWRLGSIDAQVPAPTGWTRLDGDRGLIVWATDGTERQTYWVMPRNWKGEVYDPRTAAREVCRSEELVLYAQHQDAPGWTASGVVQSALGFAPQVASKD